MNSLQIGVSGVQSACCLPSCWSWSSSSSFFDASSCQRWNHLPYAMLAGLSWIPLSSPELFWTLNLTLPGLLQTLDAPRLSWTQLHFNSSKAPPGLLFCVTVNKIQCFSLNDWEEFQDLNVEMILKITTKMWKTNHILFVWTHCWYYRTRTYHGHKAPTGLYWNCFSGCGKVLLFWKNVFVFVSLASSTSFPVWLQSDNRIILFELHLHSKLFSR